MADRICPVCGEPAIRWARTPALPCQCKAGHEWFYCLIHDQVRAVVGKYDFRRSLSVCQCPEPRTPKE